MADRDDSNLVHFKSRSKQPRSIGNVSPSAPGPTQYEHDQSFGSTMSDMNPLKFNYIGTDPQLTLTDKMSGRRTTQYAMGDGFRW